MQKILTLLIELDELNGTIVGKEFCHVKHKGIIQVIYLDLPLSTIIFVLTIM